jgi:adenylate cyclase
LIKPIRERFSAAAATIEKSLNALPQSPQNERLRERSETLLAFGGGAENVFEARSQELQALAETQRSLQAKREEMAAAMGVAHRALLETLTPMIDDASFDLVITSEDVTAKSKEEITGLVEGGVKNLQALLTINAEGNLAAGLLAEGGHVDDPTLIKPIRERFSAAAATIEKSLNALPQSPQNERLRERSETLLAFGGGADNVFEARSQELQALAETQRSLQAKREEMAAAMGVAHRALLESLTPMIDDASFDLVITSEDVTAKSKEEITGLVEGGVKRLQVLLTLRAEGNLAAGLLTEAATVPDPISLEPLRERFVAAASRAEKLLTELPTSAGDEELRNLTKSLLAFGTSRDNVFNLRDEELRKIEVAQVSLQANSSLVLLLGEKVAELVLAAQSHSDDAAVRSDQAIDEGRILLLLFTAVSVIGAVAIAAQYVVPRVVRPIESITTAMTGLAAGDTSIDVPGRNRSDEIGRMANALGVFRDTAIEVQNSNLREIREGRRRLTVAIESISEAFSLYDGEDRLVVCNNKYRTLLYPGDDADISPGMEFEDIIRRAAERGYVKDAEGRVEDWVRERLARHREPSGPHVQQRADGSWILVSERKTDDGGTVAVYSDITEMKQRENELADKSKALELLSSQLAKYLSPQVYESIFTGKQEVKITSRRKKLTVFFSDIARFTETTDRLESEDLTQLLNHYLTEMSEIALFFGATVDKYVGDAIVIFFGDPETRGVKEDACACVEMAIAMRKRMRDLQDVWRKSGIERPLECRIGINTGYSTVGNFGSENRMDYTIIGGGVNLASRLEAAATPGDILVSYETYTNIRDRIYCEEHGHISVKGIAYPVDTYRVIDTYENLGRERRHFREERSNVKLDIDLEAMTKDDRGAAADILRRAMELLTDDDKTELLK